MSDRIEPYGTQQARAEIDALDTVALDSAVGFAAEHARRYIASAGTDDGWDGPRPILILYTRGRATGAVRRNPLLYVDIGGHRHVIGSKGGRPGHPSWYLNLRAEPNVHVRAGADAYAATARTLSSDERADVWPELVARYPMFADYQARTEREIPLVRLEPASPATALAAARIATVRAHMALECVCDWDAVIATFHHPRYEMYGDGRVFDGEEAVRGYFAASRTPFPDEGNEVIAIAADPDADTVLVEFWLTGTHLGPLRVGGRTVEPTGRSFRVRMAASFEFLPGSDKIVCERPFYDQAAVLRALDL